MFLLPHLPTIWALKSHFIPVPHFYYGRNNDTNNNCYIYPTYLNGFLQIKNRIIILIVHNEMQFSESSMKYSMSALRDS